MLLAIGRSVGLGGAADGPAVLLGAQRGISGVRGAEILVGEQKQVGGVPLPTRLEL